MANFIYTPNEARALLDLEAKEGGDRLLGNGGSIPIDIIGAQYTDISSDNEDNPPPDDTGEKINEGGG